MVHLSGPYCRIRTAQRTIQNAPFHHGLVCRIINDSRDFKQRKRGLQNPQKDWGENTVVAGVSKRLSSHYKTPHMMSLKEVRNQLLISHDDGVINDEELLLLYDLNRSDNLGLPYNSYPGFDFDDLEDDECLSEFRFYKNDLPFLAEVLGIPEVVECYQRSICSNTAVIWAVTQRSSCVTILGD